MNEFRMAQDQGMVHSLAWVIMPDHFHWLVELRIGTLSELMRKVKAGSARAISATGVPLPIWQKGYHDRAIRQESAIINAARYIVDNPRRAGLVKRCGDYPLWDAIWL